VGDRGGNGEKTAKVSQSLLANNRATMNRGDVNPTIRLSAVGSVFSKAHWTSAHHATNVNRHAAGAGRNERRTPECAGIRLRMSCMTENITAHLGPCARIVGVPEPRS